VLPGGRISGQKALKGPEKKNGWPGKFYGQIKPKGAEFFLL